MNTKKESPLPYLAILGMILATFGVAIFGYKLSCGFDPHQLVGLITSLAGLGASIWLFIHSQIERKRLEEEERESIEAAARAEIEKAKEERINVMHPDPSDQKECWIVPVLADTGPGIPLHMGMLLTEKAKVGGKVINFMELIKGDGNRFMNVVSLPENPGGAAGKSKGLSHRLATMSSGMSHHVNSFVLADNDVSVLVVLLYNTSTRETGKVKDHVEITNYVDPAKLNPLTERILRCDFVSLEVLEKELVNPSPLLLNILARLPKFIADFKV